MREKRRGINCDRVQCHFLGRSGIEDCKMEGVLFHYYFILYVSGKTASSKAGLGFVVFPFLVLQMTSILPLYKEDSFVLQTQLTIQFLNLLLPQKSNRSRFNLITHKSTTGEVTKFSSKPRLSSTRYRKLMINPCPRCTANSQRHRHPRDFHRRSSSAIRRRVLCSIIFVAV